MRLFGKVDGVVDRFDRAGWLSLPFDLAWTTASYNPYTMTASVDDGLGMAAVVTGSLGLAAVVTGDLTSSAETS